MNIQGAAVVPSLYEQDETAWLEQTADLVAHRRWEEIDCEHLSEYLTDMARRDKREVFSRLVVFLSHRLKWEYQPDKRTNSWEQTIVVQRQELLQLFESGMLRRHGEEVFEKAYVAAFERAVVETGLPPSAFPAQPNWSLAQALQATVS